MGLFDKITKIAEKAVDEGVLDTILVPRVSEVPSRSLRSIAVDYGKGTVPERVVLTPTCELMQIVVNREKIINDEIR